MGSSHSVTPETLEEHNITYIFHLGFAISQETLDSEYFRNSCKHEYFSLEDNSQSVDEMLKIGEYIVEKIHTLMKTNVENVLVCCLMGRSRSASMIALYLHSKYPELSYEEIINKRIKKFRSISINQTFSDAIRRKIG